MFEIMGSIFYFSMQSNFPFQCLPTSAAVLLTSSCPWASPIPGNAKADIFLEPPEEAEEYGEEPPGPLKDLGDRWWCKESLV